ncbi:MAG: MarR family winged helix-turn-helix transcriptional regulator [Nakamurella sp.]
MVDLNAGELVPDTLISKLQTIYVLIDEADRHTLRPFDLTPTQCIALRAVNRTPGGLAVSRLAEQLLCTRGNATRLVRRLAAAGLVNTAGGHDQRLVLVHITATGVTRLAKAEAALSLAHDAQCAPLSHDDQLALVALAERLTSAFELSRDRRVALTGGSQQVT